MNRTYRLVSCCSAGLLAFFVSGCLEIQTTTQVNRDGTLVRMQSVSGDSAEVLQYQFPAPVDSSWNMKMNRLEKAGFERVATKVFNDAAELNRSVSDSSRLLLRIHADLQKRFAWFFTELTYRETYLNYNPFRFIPLSNYVTQADIDNFYRHEYKKEPYSSSADSLAQEEAGKRYEEWHARNIFEGYYRELLKGVTMLNDRTLTPEFLSLRKEELYQNTRHSIEGAGNMDSVRTLVQKVIRLPQVQRAMQLNEAGFAAHKERLSFTEDMLGHFKQANIVMPGLILDTNAPTIEGNKASWKEVATFAYIGDYEIWATSRVVNYWAIIIAGAVVVAAIVLLIAASVRRRSPVVP